MDVAKMEKTGFSTEVSGVLEVRNTGGLRKRRRRGGEKKVDREMQQTEVTLVKV